MLDRPPVNALSMPLIDALLAALARARDDTPVRAVIVASAHEVFCAGLDLDIDAASRGSRLRVFSSGSISRSTISNTGWASRPSLQSTARRAPAA
jgi:enoyl-CoA hydratase/carnithine racemase